MRSVSLVMFVVLLGAVSSPAQYGKLLSAVPARSAQSSTSTTATLQINATLIWTISISYAPAKQKAPIQIPDATITQSQMVQELRDCSKWQASRSCRLITVIVTPSDR